MIGIDGEDSRIRDGVRDSKIQLDISYMLNQKLGSFTSKMNQGVIEQRHSLEHDISLYGRDLPRSSKGNDISYFGRAGQECHRSSTAGGDQRNTVAEANRRWIRSNIPTFNGSSNRKYLLDWIQIVDRFFEEIQPPDNLKCKLAYYAFEGEAEIWWRQLQHQRLLEEGSEIRIWPWMKFLLLNDFRPATCSTKCFSGQGVESNYNHRDEPLYTSKIKRSEAKTSAEIHDKQIENRKERIVKQEFVPTTCLTEVPNESYISKHQELEVVICGPDEGDYLVTEEIEEYDDIEDDESMYEGLAFLFKSDYEDEELLHLKRFVFVKEISGKDIQCSLKVPSVYVGLMTRTTMATKFRDEIQRSPSFRFYPYSIKHSVRGFTAYFNAHTDQLDVHKGNLLLDSNVFICPVDSKHLTSLVLGEYLVPIYSNSMFLSVLFDPGGVLCSIGTWSSSWRISISTGLTEFIIVPTYQRFRDWISDILVNDEVIDIDWLNLFDPDYAFNSAETEVRMMVPKRFSVEKENEKGNWNYSGMMKIKAGRGDHMGLSNPDFVGVTARNLQLADQLRIWYTIEDGLHYLGGELVALACAAIVQVSKHNITMALSGNDQLINILTSKVLMFTYDPGGYWSINLLKEFGEVGMSGRQNLASQASATGLSDMLLRFFRVLQRSWAETSPLSSSGIEKGNQIIGSLSIRMSIYLQELSYKRYFEIVAEQPYIILMGSFLLERLRKVDCTSEPHIQKPVHEMGFSVILSILILLQVYKYKPDIMLILLKCIINWVDGQSGYLEPQEIVFVLDLCIWMLQLYSSHNIGWGSSIVSSILRNKRDSKKYKDLCTLIQLLLSMCTRDLVDFSLAHVEIHCRNISQVACMGAKCHLYGHNIKCSFPVNRNLAHNRSYVCNVIFDIHNAVISMMWPRVWWVDESILPERIISGSLMKRSLLLSGVDKFKKTLKLFHKLVNGLDPPKYFMVTLEESRCGNNYVSEGKFTLIKLCTVTISSCLSVWYSNEQSRKSLRLFHKVVNGLDPPIAIDGACEFQCGFKEVARGRALE